MFIEKIPVGVFRCNCIVVGCDITGKAIVVDPGDEPDRILDVIRSNGLDVLQVIHTHAHIDHLMGTFSVVEATGAPARLHEGDRPLWDRVDAVAASYSIPAPKTPPLSEPLEDGEIIRFGNAQVRVVHTPGHTSGSCSFIVDIVSGKQVLLAGDTLFRGKIGFACPPYRDSSKIISSIRDRLLTLDDNTRVIPGHGPETSIGIERKQNPFLSCL